MGLAPVWADEADGGDVVAAIQQVAPEAVADSAGTTNTTDSGITATGSNQAGTTLVPTDASAGIQLAGQETLSLKIGLPFAEQASDAIESQLPGVVVFDNNNGSSTVPVILDDGVQISTVISNANAPNRYSYPMDLPAGYSLNLNPDGSVSAIGEDGTVLVYVDAPWAKDANGNLIATHYEVSGDTLTQVVEFTDETAFPVVADPRYSLLWWGVAVKLTRSETKNLNNNYTPAYFSTLFCAYAGPYAPVCTAGLYLRLWSWQKPIIDASSQGRCAQLNIPHGTGIAIWNVTNEAC